MCRRRSTSSAAARSYGLRQGRTTRTWRGRRGTSPPSSVRAPRSRSSTTTPAAGGTSTPTSSPSTIGLQTERPYVPARLPLHAGPQLDERPERPRLLQRRVPPVLPAQPGGPRLGQYALGACVPLESRALARASCPSPPRRPNPDI